MIALNREKYPILKELLGEVQFNHYFAQAIIDCKIDGSVYVDNLSAPTTFYIKHNYGMALLAGNTENDDFNEHLVHYLRNTKKERTEPEYLQVYPNKWNEKMLELLPLQIEESSENAHKSNIVKLGRLNFQFNYKKYLAAQQNNYHDAALVQTDALLFSRIKGKVVPLHFWPNAEKFMQQSVGFSAIINNEPISTAFAAFVHESFLEIGIETNPHYHGNGYAYWVCSALIDFCIQNNFEPVWSCRADNTGSIKLAEKLGFEKILTLPFYQLPCN